jgi:uncharacterized coiled-coil DUF342 family protein
VYSTVKYNRKHNSTCQSSSSSEEASILEDKLSILENQYAMMEAEYSKKIRELKNYLNEKVRKQASLLNELTTLREDSKQHQEEITKICEQLTFE